VIRYTLVCEAAHSFEGWFRNSEDFEGQCARRLVTCPACGSAEVRKALMAPAVATSRKKDNRPPEQLPAAEAPSANVSASGQMPVSDAGAQSAALIPNDLRQKEVLEALRLIRSHILETSENVGSGFADEARKIHYGEAEQRSIYGQTTPADAQELMEEGIAVVPLPSLPEDKN
jgi:hypothetical protein